MHPRHKNIPNHPYKKITYSFLVALALVQVRERKIQTKEIKIAAAKRALSIITKFPPSEYRGKHVSRIFRNLNKLRAGR